MSLVQFDEPNLPGQSVGPPDPLRNDRRMRDLYRIRTVSVCGGTLGFGRCPGVRGDRFRCDRLGRDLDQIASWGPAAILCLVGTAEIEGLDLSRLGHEARSRGIGWLRPLMTVEGDARIGQNDWQIIAPRLHSALGRGDRLLFHGATDDKRALAAGERLLIENGATVAAARMLLGQPLPDLDRGYCEGAR